MESSAVDEEVTPIYEANTSPPRCRFAGFLPLAPPAGASGDFVGSGTGICPVGEGRRASGRFPGRA
jgi:hypothetical protein